MTLGPEKGKKNFPNPGRAPVNMVVFRTPIRTILSKIRTMTFFFFTSRGGSPTKFSKYFQSFAHIFEMYVVRKIIPKYLYKVERLIKIIIKIKSYIVMKIKKVK